MRRIYSGIVLLLLPFFVFGNNQRIIPIDSEIYSLLELVVIESGRSVLSDVMPYSEAQILRILDDIDEYELSDTGKASVSLIRKTLERDPLYSEDSFELDASAAAALELYLHGSSDESQWQYGYEDRLPVFEFRIETWFNEGFYAVMEPGLKESRFLIDYKDSTGEYAGNLTNIPASFGDVNYYFPDRGFFSFGGDNWNLQVGRDQLQYGNGETGSLLYSSFPDFYEFLKLKGFADNFAFTWTYINLENWQESGKQRFIADHALEVRLFDILSLSVNESALFYGEASELQFFSPLIIYHNLFKNHPVEGAGANICMTLGFDLVPVSGLSFYGEYLLDEVQTGLEADEYGPGVAATPNADAHMLGIRGGFSLGSGYFSGFFEYIYTSPWCYLLTDQEGSMVWSHTELNDVLNKKSQVLKPLGYKYGPDVIAFSAEFGYLMPGVFKAALTGEYVFKGENTMDTDYTATAEAARMTTPTGVAERKLVIGLNGIYELFEFLDLGLDLAFVRIDNHGHISKAVFSDFQSAASIIFKI